MNAFNSFNRHTHNQAHAKRWKWCILHHCDVVITAEWPCIQVYTKSWMNIIVHMREYLTFWENSSPPTQLFAFVLKGLANNSLCGLWMKWLKERQFAKCGCKYGGGWLGLRGCWWPSAPTPLAQLLFAFPIFQQMWLAMFSLSPQQLSPQPLSLLALFNWFVWWNKVIG